MNSAPVKVSPVLIIGAHRSGTTATTRALELLGLQVGQRLDSHHESRQLQQRHEAYLQKSGAAWHRPVPFLDWIATSEGKRDCVEYLGAFVRCEFAETFGYRNNPAGWWQRARLKFGAAWGWKEPRTTLFASCWLKVFPEARFINVVRHPLAVALSIREREFKFRATGDPPTPGLDQIEYCLRLALIYVAAGDELAAKTHRYRRVHFEALQADAPNMLRELAIFSGLHPTAEQIAQAAQSIRPPSMPLWPSLTSEDEARLLTHIDAVAGLGYDLPRPGSTR